MRERPIKMPDQLEMPDQLRRPAPKRDPGFEALDDFLWEAACWDPAIEQVLQDVCPDGTDRQLVEAVGRLLDGRLLTMPGMAYRAMRLLADVAALRPDQLKKPIRGRSRVWPRPIADPLGGGVPLTGRHADHDRGVTEARPRRSGVSILCVTGSPGVGKTRLAREIVTTVETRESALRLEVSLSSAAPGTANRQLAKTPYDALPELLIQLGIHPADIPVTLEERGARYAAALTGRKPVILIDGAVDESQVLSLLPPEEGIVVVTSRQHLPDPSGLGARYLPLKPLEGLGSRRLIQHCFKAAEAEPNETVTAAIYRWCGGMPMPTLVVSRWFAQAARAESLEALLGRFDAAYHAVESVRSGGPETDDPPAFPAVAAVFSLLDEDEQALMRALGLLRMPEADVCTMCLSTGLSPGRVRAALEQLAGLGLVAPGEPGQAWVTASLAADYARAKALAAGQMTEPEFEQWIGPVVGMYTLLAGELRNLFSSVTSPESPATLGAWVQKEWEVEHEAVAAVLATAAVSPHPLVPARWLAADFIDLAADGRYDRSRAEVDRYLMSVVNIARAADDRELEIRALDRLGPELVERVDKQASGYPGPESQPVTGNGGEIPSVTKAADDELATIDQIVQESASLPGGPLLFGTGADVP